MTNQIELETWVPVKEIGPFILWTNELQGSLLKFTITKIGSKIKPEENDSFWFSQLGAERHMEDSILSMIRKGLDRETFLTTRQQSNILRRISNRNKKGK